MSRHARVVVAFACLLLLGGCLGSPPGGAGGPSATVGTTVTRPAHESYVFDHPDGPGPVVAGGLGPPGASAGYRARYVTLLTSRADRSRLDYGALPANATAFVEATSFDRQYLVVVQTFPASSVPDHRVEAVERDGDTVRLRVNDSSRVRTADVTVETLLVRVDRGDRPPPSRAVVTTEDGVRFDSTQGVVTVTPRPTTTTTTVSLPYTGAANVDDPRDVVVENAGNETNGYELTLTYLERPTCRTGATPCGQPTREVEVLHRQGKLRPGETLALPDVAGRVGPYEVTVRAFFPDGNGSRRTVTASSGWRVNRTAGDLHVTLTDENVTVETAA